MTASVAEEEFILSTRDFFSNASIWPQQPRDVDHRGWLTNFEGDHDRAIATQLLDSFLLISTNQVEKMVTSSFHSLSPLQGDMFDNDPAAYSNAWKRFRERLAVTFPARRNDPAGSGHLFARTARALVADRDEQLFEPDSLVIELAQRGTPRPVVFVDDFSGTGNQFTASWTRDVTLPDGSKHSFASLAKKGLIEQAYFIPAVAAARAKSRIAQVAPQVQVRPAHLLPTRYSASDAATSLVEPELRADLHDFLCRYADRAGYSQEHVYGYENCGLALSFEHSTPDNTLPIFNGGTRRPSTWRALRSK